MSNFEEIGVKEYVQAHKALKTEHGSLDKADTNEETTYSHSGAVVLKLVQQRGYPLYYKAV